MINPPTEMVKMMEFAREMYHASDGVFDITIGNTLHRLGYGKRKAARQLHVRDFWRDVAVSDNEIVLPEPVMLDFGGFGKGWLIDVLSQHLRDFGIDAFIVNGGGDLYCQSETPIEFALEHPTDSTKKLAKHRLHQEHWRRVIPSSAFGRMAIRPSIILSIPVVMIQAIAMLSRHMCEPLRRVLLIRWQLS